jgi:hypothetical protein
MYVCGLVWRQEIANISVALWAKYLARMEFGMPSESPTCGRAGGDSADAGIEYAIISETREARQSQQRLLE